MADNPTIGGTKTRAKDLGALLGTLFMFGLADQAGGDAIGPILAALNRTGANDAFAIANDSNPLGVVPDAIFVTADGTLSMRGTGSAAVSFGTVKAGQVIPFRARRVMSGSTAAVIGLVY